MTGTRIHRIVSADSHTVETADVCEKGLENRYLDTALRLVEDKNGGPGWLYMGATMPGSLDLARSPGGRA